MISLPSSTCTDEGSTSNLKKTDRASSNNNTVSPGRYEALLVVNLKYMKPHKVWARKLQS